MDWFDCWRSTIVDMDASAMSKFTVPISTSFAESSRCKFSSIMHTIHVSPIHCFTIYIHLFDWYMHVITYMNTNLVLHSSSVTRTVPRLTWRAGLCLHSANGIRTNMRTRLCSNKQPTLFSYRYTFICFLDNLSFWRERNSRVSSCYYPKSAWPTRISRIYCMMLSHTWKPMAGPITLLTSTCRTSNSFVNGWSYRTGYV